MSNFLATAWQWLLVLLEWYTIFFASGALLSLLLIFYDRSLWRAPAMVLIWGLFLLIKIPTILSGLLAVPFMYTYRDVDYDRLPKWTRPWANPEDWYGGHKTFEKTSLPKWWRDKHGQGKWSFYRYHAIRNPANGLRSFELLDLDIEMSEVRYVTNGLQKFYEPWHIRRLDLVPKTVWYWCWQGWKAGCKYVHLWNDKRHFVFKFGWRVEPRDATRPIDPEGIRVDDASFATKLLPYREG